MDLNPDATDLVRNATRIVGFTGAGISTESGIPDFRSPGGVWANNRTVMFDEFVRNQEDRIEYWRQKVAAWPEMRDASPNDGHAAFASLHARGKLLAMITQNIDGLFQKSGLPAQSIVELHGTTVDVTCLTCRDMTLMEAAFQRIKAGELAPQCLKCGGILKPNTISFGQNLNTDDLRRADVLCLEADLMIAAGSSLVVQPAAGFPVLAKRNGARLIIVNDTETPLDSIADIVLRGKTGPTLQAITSE